MEVVKEKADNISVVVVDVERASLRVQNLVGYLFPFESLNAVY